MYHLLFMSVSAKWECSDPAKKWYAIFSIFCFAILLLFYDPSDIQLINTHFGAQIAQQNFQF